MIVFVIFIVSTLLLGSVYLGPASIRIWMTILMLLILIHQSGFKRTRVFRSLNPTIPICYILFLLLMFVSLTINGEVIEFKFFKKLFAYYLVCLVSYFAVGYHITNINRVRVLLLCLVLIVSFNNIIAILQFANNPFGWKIGNFFGDISSREEFAEIHSDVIGFSFIPGAMGDPVMSGFITAIIAPILFIKHAERNSILLLLIQILLIGVNLYGCYITQQRNAFILFLLSASIIALKFVKKRPVISLFGVLILFISIGYIVTGLESFEWGRLFSLENDARTRLWNQAILFIQDHPLFGGPISFQNQTGVSAHNVFLDSMIYSGFGGFFFIAFLWTWSIFMAIKYLILGIMSKVPNITFGLSIAVFNMMVYGLFHNTSFLTGYNIIFIVLACFLCSIKLVKQN